MASNRTSNYIATIPMKSEEQVIEVKKVLEQIFGWVTLRGRHSNRKSVVKTWRKSRQNDVSWRNAEYVDIYLHAKNPNYMRVLNKQGMERYNLTLNNDNVVTARLAGNIGLGYSDVVKNQIAKGLNSAFASIMDLEHEVKIKDPKYKRKEMKRKYQNKSYTLNKGDWGFIAQELLNYVERNIRVSFTELKRYYDVVLRGNPTIQKGGSFIHHLQSLTRLVNAQNRRCGRYLVKASNNGKYLIAKYNK